ncbi:MAG: putative lipid II flippase FtsW [Nitrospirae bacterium]|nr:putative lipid II flippase FtsW [Nitrospirota bacterium]
MTVANFKSINYSLFIIVTILTAIGILMIYSSSAIPALKKMNDLFFFLKRQMIWAVIGLVAMIIVSRIDYRNWDRLFLPLLFLTILLLILVLIPSIGREVNGARRWLRLGILSFQPAELSKLTIIIYMARIITKKGERIKDFMNGFLPVMSIIGIIVMLIMIEPDIGTAVTIGIIALSLLFAGGARLKHIMLLGIFLMPILYSVLSTGYRWQRIISTWDPWKDPYNSGYQIIQSYLALGSGGLLGAGLGEGKQKLFFLPEAHTDFIFSILGEELGFAGAVTVIALFAALIYLGFVIALRTEDVFARYLALGITIMIGIQAVINISVVTGLLPTKGIPLPFVSFGGSSLLVNMMSIGILMNIAEQGRG